jgi:hypothetical protein
MSAHPPAWRRPTRHTSAVLTVWLYVGVLVVSAVHHHDFASHRRSSAHCTICQVVSIVRPEAQPAVVPASLAPAGRARLEPAVRWTAASSRVLAGRSPPPVC